MVASGSLNFLTAHTSEHHPATTEPVLQLSEACWARLWALIDRYDRPPATALTSAEARGLLLAMLYRVLTENPWEDLPAWAPPAALVQATAHRWQELGLLDRLATELFIRLDEAVR